MYKEGQIPVMNGFAFDILAAGSGRVASWRSSRNLAPPDHAGLSLDLLGFPINYQALAELYSSSWYGRAILPSC